jgi:hypothetical protein
MKKGSLGDEVQVVEEIQQAITEEEFNTWVGQLNEEQQILVATAASMGFAYHKI